MEEVAKSKLKVGENKVKRLYINSLYRDHDIEYKALYTKENYLAIEIFVLYYLVDLV
jgi:hypothetical protein